MKYIFSDEIIFNAKPDAVPYNYRISYKIAQVCLIISICCRHSGCSLIKLHMVSIGLSTKHKQDELSAFIENRMKGFVVRFDPAVNRAIKYAIADGLIIQQKNILYKLSEKGKLYVEKINELEDLMIDEKVFLNEISYRLTEDKIKNLMSSWRYFNVEY